MPKTFITILQNAVLKFIFSSRFYIISLILFFISGNFLAYNRAASAIVYDCTEGALDGLGWI